MTKFQILALILNFIAQIGCRVKADASQCLADVNLPDVVGGRSIESLVAEKMDAPFLRIELNEVVLSNNYVVVTGTFTEFPGSRMTIDHIMFKYALASVVFSSAETGDVFRLVADDEFNMECGACSDQVFASSKLFAGGGRPVDFSYSYRGFPSDAKTISYKFKSQMNIIHRLRSANHLKYFMKRPIGVRFAEREYGFPNEDWSWINIKGVGSCSLKIR